MLDKESKVEIQENELVKKELLTANNQTSHAKQCKYPTNKNKSNGHIIERVTRERGLGEELKENKDAR